MRNLSTHKIFIIILFTNDEIYMQKILYCNTVCRSHGPDGGCVWWWPGWGPLLPSIWAQTSFIKVTLYTTFKGVRPHGCSEEARIFLAIPILSNLRCIFPVNWFGKYSLTLPKAVSKTLCLSHRRGARSRPVSRVLSSWSEGPGSRLARRKLPCTLMAPGASKIRRGCNVLHVPI